MGNDSRRRLGILGGTFNPVHLGHLRAGEEVREILGLDKIYFVPAAIPPHKDSSEVSSSSHRLKMVEAAISGNPFFGVSDFELEHDGPSYTIDTLRYFSSEFAGSELYFILGTDLFSEIDTWNECEKLFEVSNFALITRPGFSDDLFSILPLALKDDFRYHKKENKVTSYLHKSSTILALVEIEGIEVSSTRIRDLISGGKSVKYLVPDTVESYILNNELYKKEASSDRI